MNFSLFLYNGSSKGEYGYQSTDDDHDMVVTSSNSAYGVISASEHHDYDLIELPQMDSHHMSTTGHSN